MKVNMAGNCRCIPKAMADYIYRQGTLVVYRNTTNQGILAIYMREHLNLGPAHTSSVDGSQAPWALKAKPSTTHYGHYIIL